MSTKYIYIKFSPKIVSARKFIGSKLKHSECNTTSIFQYKKSVMTHPEQKSVTNPLYQISNFFSRKILRKPKNYKSQSFNVTDQRVFQQRLDN